jgi:hypothetical protein
MKPSTPRPSFCVVLWLSPVKSNLLMVCPPLVPHSRRGDHRTVGFNRRQSQNEWWCVFLGLFN